MGLTLISHPDEFAMTTRPIIFTFQSDRSESIYNYSSSQVANGGNTQFHFATAINLQVDDVVYLTDAYGVYNKVRATVVTVISTTEIVLDIAFISSSTVLVTRQNDNFKLKTELKLKGTSTIVSTTYEELSPSNFLYCDVSGRIRANQKFTVPKTYADINFEFSPPQTDMCTPYIIDVAEVWDNADGVPTEHATTSTSTLFGLLGALQHTEEQSLTKYIAHDSTRKFLTHKTGEITIDSLNYGNVYLYFLVDSVAYYEIGYVKDGGSDTKQSKTSLAKGLYYIPINKDVGVTTDYIEVYVYNFSTSTQATEKKTIRLDNKCYRDPINVIYQNRLGGVDNILLKLNQVNEEENEKTTINKFINNDFNVSDRDVEVLDVDVDSTTEMTIEKSLSDSMFIEELYTSKNVLKNDATNVLKPLTVLSTNVITTAFKKQERVIKFLNPKILIP